MRLTKKDYCGYDVATRKKQRDYTCEEIFDVLQKLGQLEDIEDELGIDLITLFKAISNGIYVKTKNGISKHYTIHFMRWQQTKKYCLYYRPYSHIWFKDYGKTWTLTKEELEHEKED